MLRRTVCVDRVNDNKIALSLTTHLPLVGHSLKPAARGLLFWGKDIAPDSFRYPGQTSTWMNRQAVFNKSTDKRVRP